jgi:hypothetical protein
LARNLHCQPAPVLNSTSPALALFALEIMLRKYATFLLVGLLTAASLFGFDVSQRLVRDAQQLAVQDSSGSPAHPSAGLLHGSDLWRAVSGRPLVQGSRRAGGEMDRCVSRVATWTLSLASDGLPSLNSLCVKLQV